MLVSDPVAEPERGLDPDQVRLVREAPGRDQLQRLGQEAVDRPEQQQGVIGGRELERFELLERHGWVVALGGIDAVGVAELPGRVGVNELEGSLRELRRRGLGCIAPYPAHPPGGHIRR